MKLPLLFANFSALNGARGFLPAYEDPLLPHYIPARSPVRILNQNSTLTGLPPPCIPIPPPPPDPIQNCRPGFQYCGWELIKQGTFTSLSLKRILPFRLIIHRR